MTIEKKIAIFVDGSNMNSACKAADMHVDYKKIIAYYAKQGTVVSCKYFTALPPKDSPSKLRSFTTALEYNGWTLVTKQMKSLVSDDGFFRDKGNMDVDLTVDALELAYDDRITDLILFSGDGDFKPLVVSLQRKCVYVTVVTHNKYLADELRRQANKVEHLTMLRKEFERTDKDMALEQRKQKFLDGG